jgi:hypothetical protein
VNVRLYTAMHCAVVIRCFFFCEDSPFSLQLCVQWHKLWWGRYKFETRCGNYSRYIGSNSSVCVCVCVCVYIYRWLKWPYNKFTFTVHIHFKVPCSVQWRLHKKHVKKIMCCSGINSTCLKYKIYMEFATSLFQNGILSCSAPPSEICLCWLQQARSV